MAARMRKDAVGSIPYPSFELLLVIWTLLGCAAYARHLLFIEGPSGRSWTELAGWLTSFLPWTLLSPLVFRLERRFPIMRPGMWKHVAWILLVSLPLTWLGCKAAFAMMVPVHLAFRQPLIVPIPWWTVPRCDFLLQQTLYWLTVGGGWTLRRGTEHQEMQRQSTQAALEKSELENSLRRAELETMRMRLNPHFLFNCLQNISTLARRDPDTASRMLARLGDLLRSAMGKEVGSETSLATEIDLTKAYAAIEQMRFHDRLSVLFDMEPGLEQALVPTFLLQPLVENAIKHGIRDERRPGAIWIRGFRQRDQLALIISDNGTGVPQDKIVDMEMGVGLGATSGRLERMYPDRHSLSIQRLQEGGTEVRVIIPLRWQGATEETTHELIAASHRR